MSDTRPLGDLIGGRFLPPVGRPLTSSDPATEAGEVLVTAWDASRMETAAEAAAEASTAWATLTRAERWERLRAFHDALAERQGAIADAIERETGKIRSEARSEAGSLLSRFDAARRMFLAQDGDGPLVPTEGESLEHRPLGVVGVIGPSNYPVHLVHAYALPALLAGNTVVVKPSELTPLAGQRYAEAALAAGLPPGVINVVQGEGPAGAALAANPHVRGLWFTGSYKTGDRLKRTAVDRPDLLLALELGGKNMAVVLDDADLRQAAHEIVVGGYLTTGQRCTGTERVLVHASRKDELVKALVRTVSSLRFGEPSDPTSFAGPLISHAGRERFLASLAAAEASGAEALLASRATGPGAYVTPGLHLLPPGVHDLPGYTDDELFGPDLSLETFDEDDEALALVAGNPFGFVSSVFTERRDRFERFRDSAFFGMFNWNRSTNNASSNLPFGGVGRSGNFRPGGSHTPRSVTFPMAVLQNEPRALTPRPELAATLPGPDLDRLEALHAREERAEGERDLLETPRVRHLAFPPGGRLPTSEGWLRRLYAGGRVPKEKKPPVFDHLRSSGPWFVSVDDDPLAVLDAMSQTATLPAGFAPDELVRAYVEGGFKETVLSASDPTAVEQWAAAEYRDWLSERFPTLPHVSFTNGGAEANEKAFALCHLNRANRDAHRVLAFEGSFHGRTLLALHATFSPAKRGPYEVAGYEARFAPFPSLTGGSAGPTFDEERYLADAAGGTIAALLDELGTDADPLVRAELESLAVVDRELATGEFFACIVEPMQSEGGDRYATGRFFRALRLLTRHHEVPLIMDEVQTGFGLGGPFAWHSGFDLVKVDGAPDAPDAVTFAKRAQVGVVVSRFPDPEPTSAHPASLVRGLVNARSLDAAAARRVEDQAHAGLADLARAFPDFVYNPRAHGYAFGFDLPTPELLEALLSQRFWRGAIGFAAGDTTVRYRLSRAFGATEIEQVFTAIRRSLAWLVAHPGKTPPEWEDLPGGSTPPSERAETRVRRLEPGDKADYLPRIVALEERCYEESLQDPPLKLALAFDDPHGVALVAEVREGDGWHLVGHALAAPLEAFADLDGPAQDPFLGAENTLYSLAVTVAPEHREAGLGRELKTAQLREARATPRTGGEHRFAFVTGRNRVGHADAMLELNRSLGAHVVAVHPGQYPPLDQAAAYYRIPLSGPGGAVSHAAGPEQPEALELRDGVARPFRTPPASLVAGERAGQLFGPAITKMTLCNYVTPAVVRAAEWLSALTPDLPHLFLTSSRDETVDKSLRILRRNRPHAAVAVGLEGGYLGHTTASARSLSDPRVHAQGAPFFAWPRVPHPALVGPEATIAQLEEMVARAGGPEKLFGFYLEVVQERTGLVIPAGFWEPLAAFRSRTGVPVVISETTTAGYRSGGGAFATDSLPFRPNLLTWWPGGQLGLIHVDAAHNVPDPMAMVSTWDGDELSLVRVHHQSRAARHLDLRSPIEAFEGALRPAADGAGMPLLGVGLYRVLDVGSAAPKLAEALRREGVLVRAYRNGAVALVPALDDADRAAETLARVLPAAVAEATHGR